MARIYDCYATHVPFEAGTPAPHLSLIVNDCQPAAILVYRPTLEVTERLKAAPSTTVIDVSSLSEPLNETDAILAQPHAPAIIHYTSGSNGIPKGVVLQYTSSKHEFDHYAATYGFEEHGVVLQQSVWSFDVHITQIFLALGAGARL